MATQATRTIEELSHGQRLALYDRWLAKVDRRDTGGTRACWRWRGAKSLKRNGKRGVIRVGGRQGRIVSAARVGLLLFTGRKFADRTLWQLEVLHNCGNGGGRVDCVNPHHLRFGTRQENVQDSINQRKGRKV